MKIKVYVVTIEWKGLFEDNPLIFLREKDARDTREWLFNENGYTWDDDKDDWLDKEGGSVGEEMNYYVHFHEAEIEDFPIDVELLRQQRQAIWDSKIPMIHQEGLANLFDVILDACEGAFSVG